MKKAYVSLIVISSLLICAMTSCKKDGRPQTQKTSDKEITSDNNYNFASGDVSGNITLSDYGFLNFTRCEDFEAFRKFVALKTHRQIQTYLSSIGFNSLGAQLYGEEYADRYVTDDQSIDYAFNSYKIFQVKNAIMKPISETQIEVKWQFLLTMTPANLNVGSYGYLTNGTFDPNSMDKFATNPPDESLTLFDFLDQTPTGYSEDQANNAAAMRPMFGSVTTCTDTPGGCFNAETGGQDPCSYVSTKKYFFWIKVSQGHGADDGAKYGSCAFNGY